MAQYSVKRASYVENLMTSVERVMTYTKLDSEPGYNVERHPPEHWPREGAVTFQDVSLTYYPGGPQVLKEINIIINGGAKIGVAGRTGAGKSSFVAALMRMPEADGAIMVDDVQIKEINLQDARRCISVLGQSPVLFSGSLRKNLDLMAQFQDADLWRALEDVQLKQLVESLEGQLDHELLEHGSNVSVGERQLICLARVLLQQNKIVILDEPTAHVDPYTEQTIWNVVREKLRDSTVITIAHRLKTIKDCDMILVLKNGEVDEFDSIRKTSLTSNVLVREFPQVNYCEDLGITAQEASRLFIFIGLASSIARPISGRVCNDRRVNPVFIYQSSLLIAGVSALLLPFATKYWALVVFSVAFGLSDGMFITVHMLILLSCVDNKRVTASFCIVHTLYALVAAIGGPIAGLMADQTGNYITSFYMTGGVMMVAFFIPFALIFINRGKNRVHPTAEEEAREVEVAGATPQTDTRQRAAVVKEYAI
ncbi:hypothetical protein OS493_007163 [Desmophyllum pertusum]|uniref:ABC transporter domain-containing protein n=1 Tax=Desmophyllum pertusum TaxID=174260 RepID=A0A9W9ZHS0_9CNID|nr:hypothetical protein OS493_007163 [Desmophyllum pertusum]